jgi:hypothetical protein
VTPKREPAVEKPAATAPGATAENAGGATEGDRPPAAIPPSPKRSFGVIVGTFLDEDRAKQEGARIGAAAHLPSSTLTVQEGGTSVYRVVVGRFDTNLAAETAASNLITKGLANEARIVILGGSH